MVWFGVILVYLSVLVIDLRLVLYSHHSHVWWWIMRFKKVVLIIVIRRKKLIVLRPVSCWWSNIHQFVDLWSMLLFLFYSQFCFSSHVGWFISGRFSLFSTSFSFVAGIKPYFPHKKISNKIASFPLKFANLGFQYEKSEQMYTFDVWSGIYTSSNYSMLCRIYFCINLFKHKIQF